MTQPTHEQRLREEIRAFIGSDCGRIHTPDERNIVVEDIIDKVVAIHREFVKEVRERIERQMETIHGYGGLTDEFKSIENRAIRTILSLNILKLEETNEK
jgi:hypothetical protein